MTDLRVGLTLTADGKGLVGEVRVAKEELERLGEEVRKVGGEARKGGSEVSKAGDEFKKAGSEARKAGDEVGKAGDGFRKAGADANNHRNILGQIRPDMVRTGQAARQMSQSVGNLGSQTTGASADAAHFRRVMGGMRPDILRAVDAANRKRRALKGLSTAMAAARRRADSFGHSLRRAGRAGSRLRREFIGLKATASGIAFGALIRQSTQTALAYERIDLALAAATGSMAAGRAEMAFVRAESERLGLALQPVSLQYSRIAAAAIGTNLQGQVTRDIFLGVAEAAGALSLSAAQTDGLFNAVEQTMSRGVVSAEEVRRQMGNALPGAFNIAAEAMGVTTDEFNKMLARGEVLSEDFLPRFARALRDRFGDAATEAADGATSSFNRFANALDEAQLEFANSGFLDSVTDSLNEIRDTLADDSIKENLRALGAGIGNAFKYLVENGDLLIQLATLYGGAKAGLAIAGPAAPPQVRLAAAAGGAVAAEGARQLAFNGGAPGRPRLDDEISLEPLRYFFRQALRPNWQSEEPPIRLISRTERGARLAVAEGRVPGVGLSPGEQFAARFADLGGAAAAPAPARTFTAAADLGEQLRPLVERERGLLPDRERAEIELREWGDEIRAAVEEAGGDWEQYRARVAAVINSELAATYEADAERARESLVERERAQLTSLERGEIELREWADEVRDAVEAAGGDWEQYRARVDNVISQELAQLYEDDAQRQKQAAAEIRESYLDRLRASDTFTDGVRLGWEEMRDSAETYSESIGGVFRDTVTGMERAIANFVTTGKLSFADFARSVASDLLAIGIRQGITQPLFRSFFGDGGSPAGGGGGGYGGAAVGPSGGILANAGRNPGIFSSIGSSIRNWFSGPTGHSGLIAGELATPRRMVPALAFAGAERYHGGGIVGLEHNEVPAILRRGEEVIRRDDPRHVLNNPGTVRVEIVNRGQPAAVESAQFRDDGGREQVLSIVLKDIDDNGPVAQRLGSLFGERGDF